LRQQSQNSRRNCSSEHKGMIIYGKPSHDSITEAASANERC
jgi:hypothetical protein